LVILQEIDQQIHADLDLERVAQKTLTWAMHTTLALSGTLALLGHPEAPESPNRPLEQDTWATEFDSSHPVSTTAKGRQMLRVVAHQGYSTEMDKHWDIAWHTKGGLVDKVLQTGETAIRHVGPTSNNSSFGTDHLPSAVTPRSHLVAPIKRDNTTVGLISLESPIPDAFTPEHVAFLECVTDRAAIAIGNAQRYEQANRRRTELESLLEMGLELTSSLHLQDVLNAIVAHAHAITEADQIVLSLDNPLEGALNDGKELSSPETGRHSPLSTVRIPLFEPNGGAPHHTTAERRAWGALNVSFRDSDALTREKLHALHLLADQAAIAVKNAQLYAKLQHAQKAQADFINAASQELKVPVTSMQGYANLIAHPKSGPITEQQKTYLGIIQKNIQRINRLVDKLGEHANMDPNPDPAT
jgi:GAF domain-containing protein